MITVVWTDNFESEVVLYGCYEEQWDCIAEQLLGEEFLEKKE